MMHRLEKCTIAYALIALSCYCVSYSMSNSEKNSVLANTITLACQNGEIQISSTALYLLPAIKDIADEMSAKKSIKMKVLFNTQEIQTIINIVQDIHRLLNQMTHETTQKYNITKKYTPDDIPLHVRRIVQSHTNTFNRLPITAKAYAKILGVASYFLAPYLANALAAEWCIKKFPLEDDALNSYDNMTLINKYRNYAQEKIYYECSIADLLLTSRNHHNYSSLETELTKVQPNCTIPLILPMKDYIPDTPVGNAIITSLVGWEFINKTVTEYPKQITIWQKLEEKIPVMSEFYDIDETDSSEKEELTTISHNVKFTIPILKSDTFLGLPSLVSINLNNLGIITIEGGAFSALPKLQDIELKNNAIKTISSAVFEKTRIKKIDLYGNPLLPNECARLKAIMGNDSNISCNK